MRAKHSKGPFRVVFWRALDIFDLSIFQFSLALLKKPLVMCFSQIYKKNNVTIFQNQRYIGILCTGAFLYVLNSFVLIFNKFWFSSLLVEVRGTGHYEKFTAWGSKFVLPHWGLEWALKPVMYSVGNVPGSFPGQLHWKMSKGKKPTQIPTGDPQITKQTLKHCAMLACLFVYCIFILTGWGRGIKSVYTQIRTRDSQITRPALYNWARQAC